MHAPMQNVVVVVLLQYAFHSSVRPSVHGSLEGRSGSFLWTDQLAVVKPLSKLRHSCGYELVAVRNSKPTPAHKLL